MKKKVLIKGAGDLATGIACRLHNCGFRIVMTETAVPTTVRRTIAFSRAVYENRAQVEGIEGVLCRDLPEIEKALAQEKIAVIVDEDCRIVRGWKPDIEVDAIIAKKNTGTTIQDAPIVIAAGPGFKAGKDCHCVIETKRGHDLGRCIWSGEAAANTGIPGMIGGYGIERLIKAPCDGIFFGTVPIGYQAAAGETVGYVSDGSGKKTPVTVSIQGVIRGILQDGVPVKKGMKAGDVDPRDVVENCHTVSDKARAVGGGVLEAILALENRMEKGV